MMDITPGDRVIITSTPEYFKHKIGWTGIVVMAKPTKEPNTNEFMSDDLMITLDNGGFTFLQKKNLTKLEKQNF